VRIEDAQATSADPPTWVGASTIGRAEPATIAELQPGAVVGRYVVLGRLGHGAMGVVYAAHDPQLGRKIAVKILHHEVDDEEGRGRLLREAQALALLAHPNVVAIHDAGTLGERVWIAMEFIEGRTLGAWFKERRRPWTEVLPVLLGAGLGLAAAHDKGLVHRDFKPESRCPAQTVPLPPFGRILARRGDLSGVDRRVMPRHAAVLATAGQRAGRFRTCASPPISSTVVSTTPRERARACPAARVPQLIGRAAPRRPSPRRAPAGPRPLAGVAWS